MSDWPKVKYVKVLNNPHLDYHVFAEGHGYIGAVAKRPGRWDAIGPDARKVDESRTRHGAAIALLNNEGLIS
jgi:hypothetical protein